MAINQRNPSNLNIAFWNAQGLQRKTQELASFLAHHNIDIMLISETHFRLKTRPRIANYILYKTDRQGDISAGGTAIYIKRNIKHSPLPPLQLQSIETTGITIQSKRAGNIDIYAIYYPPGKALQVTDLNKLTNSNNGLILAGDFNAKHEAWNSKTRNSRGTKLMQYLDQKPIAIAAPAEPTHYHNDKGDILDFALIQNIKMDFAVTTIEELTSDHFPVLLTIDDTPQDKPTLTEIVDWKQYRESFSITQSAVSLESPRQIEDEARNLENCIKTSLNRATSKIATNHPTFKLPQHILHEIKEKNKLRKEYYHTLDPDQKRKLNALQTQIKNLLQEYRNDQWRKKVESIDEDPAEMWKTIKSLRREPTQKTTLKSGHQHLISNVDKAEAYADLLEKQFSNNIPTPANLEAELQQERQHFEDHQTDMEMRPATIDEVQTHINNLPNKKAPGPDGIKSRALKELPANMIGRITNIINAILKHTYFPQTWKTANIIMIHKTGKPKNEITSYRPISLLNFISKIAEKCIQTRLNEELAEKETIPNTQAGFKKHHSTIHQILRITTDITNNLNWKRSTASAFLDVEKAFDKIWHPGLIHKLRKAEISKSMTRLIQNYLTDRSFRVIIDDVASTTRIITAGVPQGSILGPTLFNIYVSDYPPLKRSQVAFYADDTVLYSASHNENASITYLQEDLDKYMEWINKWKMKINEQKSVPVMFNANRFQPTVKLKINHTEIEWQNSAKYLGITLDKYLRYTEHVLSIKRKANQAYAQLYPLMNRKNKHLTAKNKLRIYNAVVKPAILYGIEVWGQTTDTNKLIVQRIQNKYLRTALDAPWYIRNKNVHKDTNTRTITEEYEHRKEKIKENLSTHRNPLFSQLINIHKDVGLPMRRKFSLL